MVAFIAAVRKFHRRPLIWRCVCKRFDGNISHSSRLDLRNWRNFLSLLDGFAVIRKTLPSLPTCFILSNILKPHYLYETVHRLSITDLFPTRICAR